MIGNILRKNIMKESWRCGLEDFENLKKDLQYYF